jgi:hypothetical protein
MVEDESDNQQDRKEALPIEELLNLYDRAWREQFGDPGVSVRDKARDFGVELSMPQQQAWSHV